ncbi:MAG TPA: class I SAM-dependent methyltransferase [Actinomycetota bacterium]|nr:class I SAM-dependent methyltransferase [Actinomycetota bacterium]
MLERLWSRWNFRRMEECATLLRWLEPRRGERILDIGSGHGFNDRDIASAGARVAAIDLDRDRLRYARTHNAVAGVRFLAVDAERLPFDDASFDKVVSFCVIEHFRDDDAVLDEVARVLVPGGWLVLSADSLSNPELRDVERTAQARRYSVNNLYTIGSLREKLAARGFEVQRWRYILTSPFTLALVRLSWRLDELPEALLPAKVAGYVALSTLGRAASAVAEAVAGRRDTGLTLLVKARKRR